MRHVRGRNDLIVAGLRQPLLEECGPFLPHESTIGSLAELAAGLAFGIVIDDDDGTVVGLAARLGLLELRRVKRAVTTATDDDDVSQRISLPPSTTRIVPVT